MFFFILEFTIIGKLVYTDMLDSNYIKSLNKLKMAQDVILRERQ